MRSIKILPLMIVVAMLAFSVRLVEVATGFSSFAGAVMAAAEEVKDAQTPDESKLATAPKPGEAPPAETTKLAEEAAKPEEKAAEAKPAEAEKGGLIIDDDTKEVKEEAKEAASEDKKAADGKAAEPVKTAIPQVDTPGWQDPNDLSGNFGDVKEELLEDLSKRRQDLDKREKQLQTQEALLKATKKELDQKFQELSQLRSEIEKLLEKQSEEEKARISSLVKIYEGMKPKDAARIFDTLDLDVLVSVMSRMSERKLSPILAEMNDDRARTITIMLAEQKQLPSLPDSN